MNPLWSKLKYLYVMKAFGVQDDVSLKRILYKGSKLRMVFK
jgi:hypothetical protein